MGERAIYASRLSTVLERLAETVEGLSDEQVDRRIIESGSSPAMIVAHVTGAVQAAVLGIGCGQDIRRQRDAEFLVRGVPAADLATQLRALARDTAAALTADGAPPLDEVVTPPLTMLGLQPQRSMERREAVMPAIVHAAEHLGELMLTRDLMSRDAGGAGEES